MFELIFRRTHQRLIRRAGQLSCTEESLTKLLILQTTDMFLYKPGVFFAPPVSGTKRWRRVICASAENVSASRFCTSPRLAQGSGALQKTKQLHVTARDESVLLVVDGWSLSGDRGPEGLVSTVKS